MEQKKNYKKPESKVVELKCQASLMALSGEEEELGS